MTVNIESTLNSLEGSEIKSLFSLFSMTCNKWHFLSRKCLNFKKYFLINLNYSNLVAIFLPLDCLERKKKLMSWKINNI